MEKEKHYLVAVFDDQDDFLHGVEHIRHAGVKIHEAFTPYPVHRLEDALGYERSLMPVAAFCFGALGTTFAITMQTSMMAIDWPMIIGGKPFLSIPDFVPVSFECTVLFAAFGMVGTFLFSNDLKPYKVPKIFDMRSTDDKLVLAIDLAKNSLSEDQIKMILKEAKAEEVYRKDFTEEENEGSFIKYLIDLFNNGVTRSSRQLS